MNINMLHLGLQSIGGRGHNPDRLLVIAFDCKVMIGFEGQLAE